ncbi:MULTISPECIES: thiamine-phosphate kinase [Kordiimonas]|jgi:thiamine-monophosphate kinase|uniref:thiamine-phosphate kinase n=1 Tax=Kordiimonas TaxID=288021 RepID=UPI00257F37BC|nr:thiamine-phosphate kinase [Kordiimonas sp. UBA4487]
MAGEFDLIARYFRPLAGPEGLGLADDAACLTVPDGHELVVTKDLIVEGVHFVGDEPAADIAWKALAVNLSDLAAKGACPTHYFVGISLPKGAPEAWIADFAAGLKACQEAFGIQLAGGDTTASTSGVTLSITAMGTVPSGTMIKRSGAQMGDDVYVSGTLGDAALGLKMVQGRLDASEGLVRRYRKPTPRVALGQALRGVASACADVSDGLLADLGHICAASAVGARVDQSSLPLSEAVAALVGQDSELWPSVYAGGDDYELVFTASPSNAGALERIAVDCGVQLTRIGEVEQGGGCHLVDSSGNLVQSGQQGYQHF